MRPSRLISVWVDGCFDLFHYGHANLLRQARDLGGRLTVGIHSAEDIYRHKGVGVMTDEERVGMVKLCRFADEVYEGAPYVTDMRIIREKGIDVVVHGDDPITDASGRDCYLEAKNAGVFREVERTRSVSTTDLLKRLLDQHGSHAREDKAEELDRLVRLFRAHLPERRAEAGGAVYLTGFFDLYLPSTAHLLKEASRHGSLLLVGIFSDEDHRRARGGRGPIMAQKERELSLLSNKYADDVIANAPLYIDQSFVDRHNIGVIILPEELGQRTVSVAPGVDVRVVRELEHPFKYFDDKYLVEKVESNSNEYRERNEHKKQKENTFKVLY